ncbi:hypothetical protein PAXINDRAFT_97379, partial [Paxillus involutus ATCC 200175]
MSLCMCINNIKPCIRNHQEHQTSLLWSWHSSCFPALSPFPEHFLFAHEKPYLLSTRKVWRASAAHRCLGSLHSIFRPHLKHSSSAPPPRMF